MATKTGGKRMKETLSKVTLKEGEMIDTYNRAISTDGISFTLLIGVDFRNSLYVVVKDERSQEIRKL